MSVRVCRSSVIFEQGAMYRSAAAVVVKVEELAGTDGVEIVVSRSTLSLFVATWFVTRGVAPLCLEFTLQDAAWAGAPLYPPTTTLRVTRVRCFPCCDFKPLSRNIHSVIFQFLVLDLETFHVCV